MDILATSYHYIDVFVWVSLIFMLTFYVLAGLPKEFRLLALLNIFVILFFAFTEVLEDMLALSVEALLNVIVLRLCAVLALAIALFLSVNDMQSHKKITSPHKVV